MTYSVFDHTNKKNQLKQKLFFDAPVTIARFEQQKYPWLEKLTDKQLGFYWRPEEVDVTKDSKDFKELLPHEQHIFTSNLKRQILLDSVQGRSPSIAFLPVCSLPELEVFIETWSFFETIHSRSYTHLIRNVYSDPSAVFDTMMDVPEIVECAKDISKYYDSFIQAMMWHLSAPKAFQKTPLYLLKKKLWLCLNSVNILEGIRFYVSFACSWGFAELKKMEGNAKIIKLIARDENLHLAATQQLLKTLVTDDKDFMKIKKETQVQVRRMFISAVEQEEKWCEFLFKDGSMIGLNEPLLKDYLHWIAHKRMLAIDIESPYKGGSNPLPWTQKWIAGSEVQVAPQETEISSYIVGGIEKDIDENTFEGFEL